MINFLTVIAFIVLICVFICLLVNLIIDLISNIKWTKYMKEQRKLIKIQLENEYKKSRKEQK